jgi:hypothetical protein
MTKEKKRKLMARFVAEENAANDNQGGNLSNGTPLIFLLHIHS